MFNFNKTVQQDNETLNKRLNDIETSIAKLNQICGSLQLENADLRNKVLRKIQSSTPKDIKEEEITVTKTYKPGAKFY